MRMLVWAGRETQDFASLLWLNAYVFSVLWHAHVGMGYSGDAKFCVSRGRNAYVFSVLWHAHVGMGCSGDARFCVSTLVECIYGKSVTSCLWRMLAARRQRVMAGRVRRSSVCALAFAKVAGDVIVCKAHLFVARATPFCLSCHGRTCVILLNLLARSAAQSAYVGA